MIADSIAFLVGAGQARRCSTPSTSSTAGAPTPATRWTACARPPTPAPSASCSATPTAARCPTQIARGRRAVARGAARRRARHPHATTTPAARVANTLVAVEAGATQVQGTINGIGERTGNANLVTIIADLQLKMGLDGARARAARALTEHRALRRRAAQPRARPRAAVRRQARLRAQGRACTPPASAPTPRRSSTSTRRSSATRATCSISELAGRGHGRREGARPPASRSTTTPPRGSSSASRSSSTAGYQFEAADASFELLMRRETGAYEPLFQLESWRVIVEQRADGKVETEATIKIWIDGERYVRTAEGNGPVNALDSALRDAIGEIHPHLRRHRARQLQGPHPRRDARAPARSTRVLIDASDGERRLGHDRRRRERHRRLAGRRSSTRSRTREQPGRAGAARPRGAGGEQPRPGVSAAAGRRSRSPGRCWARRRSGGPRGAALRASSRSARACPAFEQAFAARLGAPHASAVSSGTAGLHLALRAVGVKDGDEVVTSPFSFVASANACLFERARAGLRRHRPGHAEPRPAGGRGGGHRAHDGAAAGPHLRLPGRPAGVRARSGLPIVEDACEALGARPRRRHAGRRRAGTRPSSASTPTSSSRRARAAWSRWPTPR